jgi:hypothetical protein
LLVARMVNLRRFMLRRWAPSIRSARRVMIVKPAHQIARQLVCCGRIALVHSRDALPDPLAGVIVLQFMPSDRLVPAGAHEPLFVREMCLRAGQQPLRHLLNIIQGSTTGDDPLDVPVPKPGQLFIDRFQRGAPAANLYLQFGEAVDWLRTVNCGRSAAREWPSGSLNLAG